MSADYLVTSVELARIYARALAIAGGRQRQASWPRPSAQFSPYRGQGLELHDLRCYQPGDDVRHIAWRASARGGPPLVKVFQAERQERCFLVLDQHPGMMFGTHGSLKAATAVRCAAVLAFVAIARQSDVGGLVIHPREDVHAYASSIDHALALLRAANRLPVQRHWRRIPVADTLERLRRLVGKQAAVYIVSDFLDWGAELSPHLLALGDQCELHAVQIFDEGEQQLPAAGQLRLFSPFSGRRYVIDSGDPGLRQRYGAQMQARQHQLQALLHRHGIQHHRVSTEDDFFKALANVECML